MISRKLDTALLLAFLLVQLFSVLSVHVITIKGSPDVDNPEHIHLTYQGDPASTVTVTWQTSTPTASNTVLYDTVSRDGTPSLYRYSTTGSIHTYDGASGYINEVELTNLEANTTYYFICGGPGIYSEERSFRTAPRLVSDFRFVVGGDSRTNLAERVKVSQAMRHTNPSFVLHSGDLVTDGTIQSQWDTWFTDVKDNWVGDNGLTIPLIPSLGNHEKNATNYFGQFALPMNEQWYYYDWGPTVRVIILNSDASPSQISTDQVNWLESVLASTPEYKWKIVMFHRNVYSVGGLPNATNLQQHWVPVFDKYHVDIVFQGHSHYYHRTRPLKNNSIANSYNEGTIYVTSGGWSSPLQKYQDERYSAYGKKTIHFTLVSVYRNGTLHIEATDVNGFAFNDIWLYNDMKYWNFANGIYFQTAANITQPPLLTNYYLKLTIDAPNGTTSTTKIYCTNIGKPHTVDGVSSWSYDDYTKILIANVTHNNLATTVMVVFDTDGDRLTNEEEVDTYGTSPTSADTDGDKLADGEEVITYGTSPTSADTDGDKLADGEEVQQGMDPLNHDTDHDLFSDSIDPLPMLNNWFIILPGLGLAVAIGVAIRIRSK